MREIKFRAWDKTAKIIIEHESSGTFKKRRKMKKALIILLVFLFQGCIKCDSQKSNSIAASRTIPIIYFSTTFDPIWTSDGTPDSGYVSIDSSSDGTPDESYISFDCSNNTISYNYQDVIKSLANSGEICKIYGHWWKYYGSNEDNDLQDSCSLIPYPETVPWCEVKRICKLCDRKEIFKRTGEWIEEK